MGWNAVGVVVLGVAAIEARSIALAGFGLDSVVEIGASSVVLWELTNSSKNRQATALRLIGVGFMLLALYVAAQSSVVLLTGYHPKHSLLGIGWTAVTALVMFTLAAGKARTGRELQNPVLQLEGRVTFVDGLLATAVLIGLVLNTTLHAWWADPLAGYVIVFYAIKESLAIFPRHD
jgi:divalent metal cation (Fe/Co/Zn/Cd) transporter